MSKSINDRKEEIQLTVLEYLQSQDVVLKSVDFKKDFFTSIELNKNPDAEHKITYVFPKMPQNHDLETISKRFVNRFFESDKSLGFQIEDTIKSEDDYHFTLLLEAANAYALTQDIKRIKERVRFNIHKFTNLFEDNTNLEALIEHADEIQNAYFFILFNHISSSNQTNIPSLYDTASKMTESANLDLIRKHLGSETAQIVMDYVPYLN